MSTSITDGGVSTFFIGGTSLKLMEKYGSQFQLKKSKGMDIVFSGKEWIT
jgi:hypothetical protein